MPIFWWGLIWFIFGLAVGSFLNVVIYRLPRRQKIVKSRSRCPFCRKTLRWFELFPLVSFLIQKGRCRRCRKKISWQYPLVELATGLAFLGIFWRVIMIAPAGAFSQAFFGWGAAWPAFLILLWAFYAVVLIIVFLYDLKYYLIPDKVIFPAIGVAFAANLLLDAAGRWSKSSSLPLLDFGSRLPYQIGGQANFSFSGNAAALIFSAFFFVLYFVSRGRWLGFGDVKLAIFLGLIVGFPGVIWSAFLAFFAGSIVGLALIILKRKKFKSEIPFGPFLCFGTWLTFLFGFMFFKWYSSLPFSIIDYF